MSDPCNQRFHTWIAQKIGGSMIGEVVVAELYDAAQSELSALREDLATLRESYESMRDRKNSIVYLQKCLTAAEQRNAELVELLEECGSSISRVHHFALKRKIEVALTKPTESGASE